MKGGRKRAGHVRFDCYMHSALRLRWSEPVVSDSCSVKSLRLHIAVKSHMTCSFSGFLCLLKLGKPEYIEVSPHEIFSYVCISGIASLEEVLVADLRTLFTVTGSEAFCVSYRAFTGEGGFGGFVAGASGAFFQDFGEAAAADRRELALLFDNGFYAVRVTTAFYTVDYDGTYSYLAFIALPTGLTLDDGCEHIQFAVAAFDHVIAVT